MKKSLLIFVSAVFCCISVSFAQSDTVSGFSFPVQLGTDSLNANFGDALNLGYDIRFETESTASSDSITLTNGVYSSSGTDFAATADDWHNGNGDKYWSVKFKTTTYTNLVLYSAQRSGGAEPGPKYFKVQYKIGSSGTWTDVSTDTVTVANDWTTGVVDGWALPSETWNAGQSVYVRWLCITDVASDGGVVDSLGISKIDEIYIIGTNNVGITEPIGFCQNVYPNPASDMLNIDTDVPIANAFIMSMDGRLVQTINKPGSSIDISSLVSGIYMIQFVSEDEDFSIVRRIVVE